MVKSNPKKIKVKKVKVRMSAPVVRSKLDTAAAQWAALLNDPCNGTLTHPIYAGAEGGALIRVENEFTLFNSGTDVCGMFAWVPGQCGTTAAAQTGGTNPATLITLADYSTNVPGYTFLRNNSSSARCVAACAQLYWPGTELNRQGFVAGGQISGATYLDARAAAAMSPDTLRTLLPNRLRMPDGAFEVKWCPSAGDTRWVDPNDSDVGADINTKTAIAFSVNGIPVSTGVRIRCVAVYEYLPKYGNGVVQPFNSRARSSSTLDDVINYLDSNYPSWRARVAQIGLTGAYGLLTRVRAGMAQARIEL